MCHFSVGYNYYDIKPTMRWLAEQHKRQRFIVFLNKLGFVLWGFLKIFYLVRIIKSKNINLVGNKASVGKPVNSFSCSSEENKLTKLFLA